MERSVKLKLLDHEKKIWDHEDVAAADEDVDEVTAVDMAAVITEDTKIQVMVEVMAAGMEAATEVTEADEMTTEVVTAHVVTTEATAEVTIKVAEEDTVAVDEEVPEVATVEDVDMEAPEVLTEAAVVEAITIVLTNLTRKVY